METVSYTCRRCARVATVPRKTGLYRTDNPPAPWASVVVNAMPTDAFTLCGNCVVDLQDFLTKPKVVVPHD